MNNRSPNLPALDVDTAEKLASMARHSRWSDDRIARWLAIPEVYVRRARQRVARNDVSFNRVQHVGRGA